jgi:hypothetical protein
MMNEIQEKLLIKVIWDQNEKGWFCRLHNGQQEVDSLPVTVSLYTEDSTDEELQQLAREAANWEGIDGEIEVVIHR